MVLRVVWFDVFFVFVTICGPERRKYTSVPAPDTGISKYVNIIARSAHFFARVRTLDARALPRVISEKFLEEHNTDFRDWAHIIKH